jgi:phage terminase large subunit-like protein
MSARSPASEADAAPASATTASRAPRLAGLRVASAARGAALKLSREVAWYLLSRGYELPKPWQVPLFKTPEPGERSKNAVFDPDRVDRVLRCFGALRHTKGDFAGRALDPDVWQIAYVLAPAFGWVEWNDALGAYRRIIREVYIEVSRKNGKSTLIGGVGLYLTCADGEQGAEVIAAATTTDQARFVFDPVKALAKGSAAVKPYTRVVGNTILHPPSGSYFKAIANVGDSQMGANLHGYCVDEIHVHKTPDLIEAIETGTGSRSQPLGFLITTADDGRPDTIYVRKRTRVVQLAQRTISDPTTYGVIWAAAESEEAALEAGLDLYGVEAMRRANPGYGVSPSAEYLQRQALIAKQSPASRSSYLRLHLGVRTKQATAYISLDKWNANASIVSREKLLRARAYGGLDLASTQDFTAFALVIPDGNGGYDALWRMWIPEGAYDRLVKRTARNAEVWRREGRFVVTDGDVVDDEIILRDILRDCADFDVAEIGFDPWNASALTNALTKAGAKMVEVRQGYASMSPPLKELNKLVNAGTPKAPKFRHGGHPVVRWMVGNLAVAMDEAGNVKPDRKRSADKIDGVAAATIALARALAAPPVRRSAYRDRGLMVAK